MMASASAKTSAMIIAGKILGVAEGLRPKARMEANPRVAITIEGPTMVRIITKMMTRFFIVFRDLCYCDVPNTRNNANKAPMPATSARISRTSILGKIFGAAEGWRPKALMEVKPMAVITNNGPKMVTNMTNKIMKFCMPYNSTSTVIWSL